MTFLAGFISSRFTQTTCRIGGSSFSRNKIANTEEIYPYTGLLSCIIENHTINTGLKAARETKPKTQKHKFQRKKKKETTMRQRTIETQT
jgi:hypothetical protein